MTRLHNDQRSRAKPQRRGEARGSSQKSNEADASNSSALAAAGPRLRSVVKMTTSRSLSSDINILGVEANYVFTKKNSLSASPTRRTIGRLRPHNAWPGPMRMSADASLPSTSLDPHAQTNGAPSTQTPHASLPAPANDPTATSSARAGEEAREDEDFDAAPPGPRLSARATAELIEGLIFLHALHVNVSRHYGYRAPGFPSFDKFEHAFHRSDTRRAGELLGGAFARLTLPKSEMDKKRRSGELDHTPSSKWIDDLYEVLELWFTQRNDALRELRAMLDAGGPGVFNAEYDYDRHREILTDLTAWNNLLRGVEPERTTPDSAEWSVPFDPPSRPGGRSFHALSPDARVGIFRALCDAAQTNAAGDQSQGVHLKEEAPEGVPLLSLVRPSPLGMDKFGSLYWHFEFAPFRLFRLDPSGVGADALRRAAEESGSASVSRSGSPEASPSRDGVVIVHGKRARKPVAHTHLGSEDFFPKEKRVKSGDDEAEEVEPQPSKARRGERAVRAARAEDETVGRFNLERDVGEGELLTLCTTETSFQRVVSELRAEGVCEDRVLDALEGLLRERRRAKEKEQARLAEAEKRRLAAEAALVRQSVLAALPKRSSSRVQERAMMMMAAAQQQQEQTPAAPETSINESSERDPRVESAGDSSEVAAARAPEPTAPSEPETSTSSEAPIESKQSDAASIFQEEITGADDNKSDAKMEIL